MFYYQHDSILDFYLGSDWLLWTLSWPTKIVFNVLSCFETASVWRKSLEVLSLETWKNTQTEILRIRCILLNFKVNTGWLSYEGYIWDVLPKSSCQDRTWPHAIHILKHFSYTYFKTHCTYVSECFSMSMDINTRISWRPYINKPATPEREGSRLERCRGGAAIRRA